MYEDAKSAVECCEIAKKNNDTRTALERMEELLRHRRIFGADKLYKRMIDKEFREEVKKGIEVKALKPNVTTEFTDMCEIKLDECGVDTDEFKLIIHHEAPCPCVIIEPGQDYRFSIPKDHFKNYSRSKQILKFYKYLLKKGNYYLLDHFYGKP